MRGGFLRLSLSGPGPFLLGGFLPFSGPEFLLLEGFLFVLGASTPPMMRLRCEAGRSIAFAGRPPPKRETDRMIPTNDRLVMSDVPPTVTNGKGLPVTGINDVTAKILSIA